MQVIDVISRVVPDSVKMVELDQNVTGVQLLQVVALHGKVHLTVVSHALTRINTIVTIT